MGIELLQVATLGRIHRRVYNVAPFNARQAAKRVVPHLVQFWGFVWHDFLPLPRRVSIQIAVNTVNMCSNAPTAGPFVQNICQRGTERTNCS